MLNELPDKDAAGEILEIYGEIRRLWAVPYVSSLQKHLASRPGWLEWSWAALAPAFQSGQAQEAGWQAARGLRGPSLVPLGRGDLKDLEIDDIDAMIMTGICAGFTRVGPVNLMFSGLLRRLLEGGRPAGAGWPGVLWDPPATMPTPPAPVDPASVDANTRSALKQLGAKMADGEIFTPGLYRILALWPAYLNDLTPKLLPHFTAPETEAARATLLQGIDQAVEQVFAELPALPDSPAMPAEDEFPDVLAALDTYRQTSPEMVIFGGMIAESLPGG